MAAKFQDILNSGVCGAYGTVNTSSTVPVTGTFCALQCITDCVFAALTEPNGTGSLTGITIPAGQVLYGTFTGYTLTSGTVRAHKRATL